MLHSGQSIQTLKPSRDNTYCHYPFNAIALKDWHGDQLFAAWPCCGMADTSMDKNLMDMGDVSKLTPQQIFDHPRFEELRNNLQNGIKDKACEHCWKQEAMGMQSLRLQSDRPYFVDKGLNTVDIKASNLCNLQCRMCTPLNSHSLMKDYNYFLNIGKASEIRMLTNNAFQQSDPLDIKDSVQYNWLLENTDKISVIKASGGEPFYDKRIVKLLEKYVENGDDKNTILAFHTNATCFTPQVLDLIKNFDNRHTFSVDGVYKLYEYVRYPATFEELENNIVAYKKQIQYKELFFNIVVSAYNVLQLQTIYSWCKQIEPKCTVTFSEVYPRNRAIGLQSLNKNILEDALAQFTEVNDPRIDSARHLILNAISKNKENKKMLKKEFILFDKSRNQSYNDYIDERLVDYLND